MKYGTKTKQIMKFDVNGCKYTIINVINDTINPYKVYMEYAEYDENGVHAADHRRKIDEYADITSCVARIMSVIHKREMVIVPFESFYYTGK